MGSRKFTCKQAQNKNRHNHAMLSNLVQYSTWLCVKASLNVLGIKCEWDLNGHARSMGPKQSLQTVGTWAPTGPVPCACGWLRIARTQQTQVGEVRVKPSNPGYTQMDLGPNQTGSHAIGSEQKHQPACVTRISFDYNSVTSRRPPQEIYPTAYLPAPFRHPVGFSPSGA